FYLSHAFSAATRPSFQHDRVTDFLSGILSVGDALQRLRRSPHDRSTRLNRSASRARLGPHHLHRFRRGANEHQSGIRDGAREVSILREKTVTGMNRLGTMALRDLND